VGGGPAAQVPHDGQPLHRRRVGVADGAGREPAADHLRARALGEPARRGRGGVGARQSSGLRSPLSDFLGFSSPLVSFFASGLGSSFFASAGFSSGLGSSFFASAGFSSGFGSSFFAVSSGFASAGFASALAVAAPAATLGAFCTSLAGYFAATSRYFWCSFFFTLLSGSTSVGLPEPSVTTSTSLQKWYSVFPISSSDA